MLEFSKLEYYSKCNTCGKTYSHTTGTANLQKHYQKHASKQNQTPLAMQNMIKKHTPLPFMTDTTLKHLITLIVKGQHSYSIVDEPSLSIFLQGFAKDVLDAQTSFRLPTRQLISKDVLTWYKSEKAELIIKFKDVVAVSLTLDIWTSCTNAAYLAITAHWINDQLEIQNVLLDFRNFGGNFLLLIIYSRFAHCYCYE